MAVGQASDDADGANHASLNATHGADALHPMINTSNTDLSLEFLPV